MKWILLIAVLSLSSSAIAKDQSSKTDTQRKPASAGEFTCSYVPKQGSFLPALDQAIKTSCNTTLPFSITEASIDLGGRQNNKTWVVCCTGI